MKVLFYVGYPLYWAKGGYTTQILETKKSLEKHGGEVFWLHHEDLDFEAPHADIVHYWSRPPADIHWELAKINGYKVVLSESQQSALLRPHWTWKYRGLARPLIRRIIGRGLFSTLGVEIYSAADATIAVTPYEAEYMIKVFGANPATTHFVPQGVEDAFLDSNVEPIPDNALFYIGYICERKNSVEVAQAALRSKVPITFVGGPLAGESDPYFQKFRSLVDGRTVKWLGEIRDRKRLAGLIRGCAGVLLASKNEASPLTVLEAIACGRAVMVSDLPNMRVYYRDAVTYCKQPDRPEFVAQLADFYTHCRNGLKTSFPVVSWDEVGAQIYSVYKKLLS